MNERDADHEKPHIKERIDTGRPDEVATAGQQAKKRSRKARSDIAQGEKSESRDLVIHAAYELFVTGLLLLQLVNSVLLFIPLAIELKQIVTGFWVGISIFLLLDALIRLTRARDRRRHLFAYYGWLRLLGSLPIPFFTALRLLGAAISLRKLRRGEFREIGNVVVARHAQSTVLLVILLAILFFEFGSLLVLMAESNAPDASIVTAQDAIWWSFVTISTVGYGDMVPTSYWGRIVGIFLILSGVGLFTSTTSYLAHWFIRPRETKQAPLAGSQMPAGPQAQIYEIRSLLDDLEDNHQQTIQDLEQRLDRLEASIAADDKQ